MSEISVESPENRRGALDWLYQNPVILKELRGRMRGPRAFILITLYLLVLGALVGGVYFIFLASQNAVNTNNDRQAIGKAIFGVLIGTELMAICFIAPALTAGAISSERERQTYDLLRTTLLPARALVGGKLFSALAFLLLMIFTALPLQSLAFLFGGVGPEEVVIATLLLVVTALTFCAVGMFFSSFIQRTLVSTVLAYAFAILMVFGVPFLVMVFSGILSVGFSNSNSDLSITSQLILLVGGWWLVSTNPLAAAFTSELILVDQQHIFHFEIPLNNGVTYSVPSPWIVYTLFYLALSLVLVWLSVRFVRRTEK